MNWLALNASGKLLLARTYCNTPSGTIHLVCVVSHSDTSDNNQASRFGVSALHSFSIKLKTKLRGKGTARKYHVIR